MLKAALDKLWLERQDFCLDIHFTLPEKSPYIKTHERYNYSELEEIFENSDILVAPSIGYETFGYTVIEALSYGVPVVISNTVGSKDILEDGAGIVIESITVDKLYYTIRELTKERLSKMNQVIIDRQRIMTLRDMTEQLEEKCYR